jgi:hypothetical protein
MKIDERFDPKHFDGYILPLRGLEASFNAAGVKCEFTLTMWSLGGVDGSPAVVINYFSGHSNARSIGGDSPAQAIKDIAGAVSL